MAVWDDNVILFVVVDIHRVRSISSISLFLPSSLPPFHSSPFPCFLPSFLKINDFVTKMKTLPYLLSNILAIKTNPLIICSDEIIIEMTTEEFIFGHIVRQYGFRMPISLMPNYNIQQIRLPITPIL